MVDRHCPFLNREDPRCAAHLQVNHLVHAFEHCAGEYVVCPSYRELLAERIMRRGAESRELDRSRVALNARASSNDRALSNDRVPLSVGGQSYADSRRLSRPAPVVTITVAARRWSFTERGLVDIGGHVVAAR